MHRPSSKSEVSGKKKERDKKEEKASHIHKTWSLPHLPDFIHRHDDGAKTSRNKSKNNKPKKDKDSHKQKEYAETKESKSNLPQFLSRFFKNRPSKQTLIEKKILPVDLNPSEHIPLRSVCIASIVQRLEDINGHMKEGIFRVPGNAIVVRDLWKRFAEDPPPQFTLDSDSSEVGPHEYAGALKLYVREAPEPPIPYSYWQKFIDAMRITDSNQRLKTVRQVYCTLPRENQEMLRTMMIFFRKVSLLSAKNKMEAKNLGILWGPTILKKDMEDSLFNDLELMNLQGQLVSTFILSVAELFGDDIKPVLQEFEAKNKEIILDAVAERARTTALLISHNDRLREANKMNRTSSSAQSQQPPAQSQPQPQLHPQPLLQTHPQLPLRLQPEFPRNTETVVIPTTPETKSKSLLRTLSQTALPKMAPLLPGRTGTTHANKNDKYEKVVGGLPVVPSVTARSNMISIESQPILPTTTSTTTTTTGGTSRTGGNNLSHGRKSRPTFFFKQSKSNNVGRQTISSTTSSKNNLCAPASSGFSRLTLSHGTNTFNRRFIHLGQPQTCGVESEDNCLAVPLAGEKGV